MTGDSGRAKGSDKITQLEPRKFNDSLLKEAKESTSFNKISKLYSYEI